jgi:hypothetical protein
MRFLLNEFHHSFSDALKTDCNFFLNPPKCSSFQRNCEETVMLGPHPKNNISRYMSVYLSVSSTFCPFILLICFLTYYSYFLFFFLCLNVLLFPSLSLSPSVCLTKHVIHVMALFFTLEAMVFACATQTDRQTDVQTDRQTDK